MLGMISIFSYLFTLCREPTYGLSLKMSHGPLRRMCILLLLGGMSYTYLLSVCGLLCHLGPICLLSVEDLSSGVSGMLKSTIIVVLSISPSKSVSSFFTYFGAPELGAYINKYYVFLVPPLSLHDVHLCLLLPFLA